VNLKVEYESFFFRMEGDQITRKRDKSISSFPDEFERRVSMVATVTELEKNLKTLSASLTIEVLEDLAVECLRDSVHRANSTTICLIIQNVFGYLDKHRKWTPNKIAIECSNIIMMSFQAQYSYVLVSQLISHLDRNINASPSIKSSIVSVLSHIISKDRTSIGLSILELLNSLLRHLSVSVYHMTHNSAATVLTEEEHFQNVIVDAIGKRREREP
jgi:hypothetical protein